MTGDLTFITNERGETLSDRFRTLIQDSRFFDCLVGYFYISGFHLISPALRNTERIRILVGLGMSKEISEAFRMEESGQLPIMSDIAIRNEYLAEVKQEIDQCPNNVVTEYGIREFVQLIRQGRLHIRIFPDQRLHAKLYIMTFREGDRDTGRIITGSSNLTRSGLVDNLEFNVELKNRADYEFARTKFEELWNQSVEISHHLVNTIETDTWLNEKITPYELYLKLLYEYFSDELSAERYLSEMYLPSGYMELEYQTHAILNARKIIQAYGGCFISDVVGLGKTYIAARLIREIGGRTIVIAPPKLIDRRNPGSWKNVFSDFNIPADFFSTGKLEEAVEEVRKRRYDNVVVDEAHRFRNEMTIGYSHISEICKGKRVILVTATPYNNDPEDLLQQISLFQNKRRSSIPGIPNLEQFFHIFKKRLENLNRDQQFAEYIRITRENAAQIRDRCLKYIMIRRTRSEIEKYFSHDLQKNQIRFPEVKPPRALFYQMDESLDRLFMSTVETITKRLTYARYTPLLSLKSNLDQLEEQGQVNMRGFMKVLLLKRFESSFHAFRQTLQRFIHSHQLFIQAFEKGKVFFSREHLGKILELLESDNMDEIQHLIDAGKAREYKSSEFTEDFIQKLQNDFQILTELHDKWKHVEDDPKLATLLHRFRNDPILQKQKIILFTESAETAEYLEQQIHHHLGEKPLRFTGTSPEHIRDTVIENFDARAREPRDDYRILISTEVLSEGVNLHRANVVINYDIPWNPTRLMQRVGRINRVDTAFDTIYTYNFFPSTQSDSEIELTAIARSKIEAFLSLLGGDSAILTEGEPVTSHELFDKLMSVNTLTGEDDQQETELKYLREIEKIRDEQPELFQKIKKLPLKARSAITHQHLQPAANLTITPQSLITFFRLGKLTKFFYAVHPQVMPTELDFLTAARLFRCSPDEPATSVVAEHFYQLLTVNTDAFISATTGETIYTPQRRGRNHSLELIKYLKLLQNASESLTTDQEEYLQRLIRSIEAGAIPRMNISQTLKTLKNIGNPAQQPHKTLLLIRKHIPDTLLLELPRHDQEQKPATREIILSLYIT